MARSAIIAGLHEPRSLMPRLAPGSAVSRRTASCSGTSLLVADVFAEQPREIAIGARMGARLQEDAFAAPARRRRSRSSSTAARPRGATLSSLIRKYDRADPACRPRRPGPWPSPRATVPRSRGTSARVLPVIWLQRRILEAEEQHLVGLAPPGRDFPSRARALRISATTRARMRRVLAAAPTQASSPPACTQSGIAASSPVGAGGIGVHVGGDPEARAPAPPRPGRWLGRACPNCRARPA